MKFRFILESSSSMIYTMVEVKKESPKSRSFFTSMSHFLFRLISSRYSDIKNEMYGSGVRCFSFFMNFFLVWDGYEGM
jgi:hypothetical protein